MPLVVPMHQLNMPDPTAESQTAARPNPIPGSSDPEADPTLDPNSSFAGETSSLDTLDTSAHVRSSEPEPDAEGVQTSIDDLAQAKKETLNDVDMRLKQLLKTWGTIRKSFQAWDFKTATQMLGEIATQIEDLGSHWQDHQRILASALDADQAFVVSSEYPPSVEAALRTAGIPIKGEFPSYEFPPFKLTFNLDNGYIRLSLGRRSQQTRIFDQEQLASWVAKQYRRVVDSRFDPMRFGRELLGAYEMLNRLSLNADQVVWGHPVPLKDLYKILTLRQAARQEYPEPLFTFDLARLNDQVSLQIEGHRFELVPSRHQSTGFLLVNQRGQESRVSSLVIHAQDPSPSPNSSDDQLETQPINLISDP